MKRTKHNLSHYRLLTCDMGELVPIGWYEVLPGDTVQQNTSLLLRVSPMLAPVMHPVRVQLHSWFVPYRLLWDNWEKFITGGGDGLGEGAVFPTRTTTASDGAGTLADYLGVPSVTGLVISALPYRAYGLIWNEFYRRRDVSLPRTVSTADGDDTTTTVSLARALWERDYFTNAAPQPQVGGFVTAPLERGGDIVVETVGDGTDRILEGQAATNDVNLSGGALGSTSQLRWVNPALSVRISELREAFALQRFAEARMMYGSRYTEYLRYLGVKSADSRLQRPEYLGGGRQTISFSEVLTTADSVNNPVGEMRGHGITSVRTRRYRRYYEEHGLCMTLMTVRPRGMYVEALPREWSRTTREDFWQRELETIGPQEVFRREIWAEAGAGGATVFGWQDRYAEYRSQVSGVSGEFRTSTMNDWHLARTFASAPALNSTFLECTPSKRIHAVQTNDVLWCMAQHNIVARRMVGRAQLGGVR